MAPSSTLVVPVIDHADVAAVVTTAIHVGPEVTLAEALHRAQAELSVSDSDVDWAAFRVIVP